MVSWTCYSAMCVVVSWILRLPVLSSLLSLSTSLSSLLIPKLTLVSWPGAQIPCLHQNTLCPIHVVFVLDLLHSNFHAILCKHNVLGLHLVIGGMAYLGDGDKDLVANKCEASEKDEEDDKRKNFAIGLC